MWKIPRNWEDELDEKLLEKPWAAAQADRRFNVFPPDHQVLRAFEEVDPKDVKCVILSMIHTTRLVPLKGFVSR